jgi:hypothetical protein
LSLTLIYDCAQFSPWMKEYVSGSGKELYSIKLHNAFNGLSFKRAAHDVFTQFQGKVVLLGIEEREVSTEAGGAECCRVQVSHIKSRVL